MAGELVLHYESPQGRFRGAKGRFISPEQSYRLLAEHNRDSAIRLQADVVDNIEGAIVRRRVSTGRLLKVTADPRNRFVNGRFGFGVGDVDYLDGSMAKYWRQIEEGTDVHVGREIRGFWGGTISGFYGNDWGRVPRGGAPFTAMGDATGGKFIPRKTGKYFDSAGYSHKKFRPGLKRIKKTVIENEIEATHSYQRAWDEGRYVQGTVDAALRDLTAMVDRVIKGY